MMMRTMMKKKVRSEMRVRVGVSVKVKMCRSGTPFSVECRCAVSEGAVLQNGRAAQQEYGDTIRACSLAYGVRIVGVYGVQSTEFFR